MASSAVCQGPVLIACLARAREGLQPGGNRGLPHLYLLDPLFHKKDQSPKKKDSKDAEEDHLEERDGQPYAPAPAQRISL